MTTLREMQVQQETAKLEAEYAYRKACRETARLWALMRHTGNYITLLPTWKAWMKTRSLQEGKLVFIGYVPERIALIHKTESLAGNLAALEALAAQQRGGGVA